MVRGSRLSQHQYDVLAWIGQGCPEEVWENFTYKTTTYALENRGLASVSKRGGTWTATLTEEGRYYLRHHAYPSAPQKAAPPPAPDKSHPHPAPAVDISAGSVVDAVQEQDGEITVPTPSAQVRQGYITAIRQAREQHLVPDGFALRYTGRDRGDLVITLTSLDRMSSPDTRDLPAVEVPARLTNLHPVVTHLQQHPELVEVSEATRRRALLILQAIAAECDRRGHQFNRRDDGKPTFQITVGEDIFAFLLSEEWERRETPHPDDLATVKYSWQRVRLSMQKVPSGRLALILGDGSSGPRWADRKRWSLADKLPALFAYLEQQAEAQREVRLSREAEKKRQHETWEQARQQAKEAFIRHSNSTRLDQQVQRWEQAAARRRYADALEGYAAGLEDPETAQQVQRWADWVQQDADRIDPLGSPHELSYQEPEHISSSDLGGFMPRGMSPWSPPGRYR